jgi:hypothetical protein
MSELWGNLCEGGSCIKKEYSSDSLTNEEKIKAIKEKTVLQKTGSESKPREPKSKNAEDIPKKEESSNIKLLLGIIGSIVLFIGVFTPIVSVPIMGNMNYFQNGKGDGTIVLVLAVISLVLVLAKKYKGLWFTGTGSLGVMLFTFINFQSKMSQAKADMESQLAGNPFRGLADMAMQSVQLQWGWALLIVGAALVIASAAMKDRY